MSGNGDSVVAVEWEWLKSSLAEDVAAPNSLEVLLEESFSAAMDWSQSGRPSSSDCGWDCCMVDRGYHYD